jgi:CD63 antigen
LPKSCCTELPANNPTCDTNDIKSNTEGCKEQLHRKIEENALILGGVGIGVALIQVIPRHLITSSFSSTRA